MIEDCVFGIFTGTVLGTALFVCVCVCVCVLCVCVLQSGNVSKRLHVSSLVRQTRLILHCVLTKLKYLDEIKLSLCEILSQNLDLEIFATARGKC